MNEKVAEIMQRLHREKVSDMFIGVDAADVPGDVTVDGVRVREVLVDPEWLALMETAMEIGLRPEDVRKWIASTTCYNKNKQAKREL